MVLRKVEITDYPTLASWWRARDWSVPSYDMLPATGMIVDGVAAGFLYRTDSKICWLEFVISNPESDKSDRSQALNLIIDDLLSQAKESGFKSVFTSLEHPGLIQRYEDFGFLITDTKMSNMIKRL